MYFCLWWHETFNITSWINVSLFLLSNKTFGNNLIEYTVSVGCVHLEIRLKYLFDSDTGFRIRRLYLFSKFSHSNGNNNGLNLEFPYWCEFIRYQHTSSIIRCQVSKLTRFFCVSNLYQYNKVIIGFSMGIFVTYDHIMYIGS